MDKVTRSHRAKREERHKPEDPKPTPPEGGGGTINEGGAQPLYGKNEYVGKQAETHVQSQHTHINIITKIQYKLISQKKHEKMTIYYKLTPWQKSTWDNYRQRGNQNRYTKKSYYYNLLSEIKLVTKYLKSNICQDQTK